MTLLLKTPVPYSGNVMMLNIRVANGTEELSRLVVGGISAGNSWTSLSFDISLHHPETVLLSATNAAPDVDIYLDSIHIVQLSYLP